MTEPQPWPTTVARRRGHPSPDDASDLTTPRHGYVADAPVAARVPSPFPRQRDAEPVPPPEAASRPAPRTETPRTETPRTEAAPQPGVRAADPVVPAARPEPSQPRPTHVRDIVEPRPSSRPAPTTTVVVRDPRALTALRVVTYVLVSLASLVFLAFVVYGGIRYVQLRDTLSTSPFGSLTGSSPGAGTGTPAICVTDPTSEACANY